MSMTRGSVGALEPPGAIVAQAVSLDSTRYPYWQVSLPTKGKLIPPPPVFYDQFGTLSFGLGNVVPSVQDVEVGDQVVP